MAAERLVVHAENPQRRAISKVADAVANQGVAIVPTDGCYVFICALDSKAAQERIRLIRGLEPTHQFAILCRDIGQLSGFAKMDNDAFRLVKSLSPGPFTFLLRATRETPKRLLDPKRKTVGIRIPSDPWSQHFLDHFPDPVICATAIDRGDEFPLTDGDEQFARFAKRVEYVVDSGSLGIEPTTILDLTTSTPTLVRRGKGEISHLEVVEND
ncbi:MAG: L-threonylcarbamoyladenylate synthase [Pseudomonadota bacterium]